MKGKIINIFWGIILILISGLLLAQALGYIEFELFSTQAWILVFGVASAAFFLSYFLNGVRKWGWLFPAFIFAALALTIWMATSDIFGSVMGMPILASIALPFYVGFALDRRRWGLLIPAFVMTVLTFVTLMADSAPGEWIGALVLFSIGLPFLVVYLRDRSKRWALIPAFIMLVLGLITLLTTFTAGDWIGVLVMYAIALPFLVVYLMDRSKRWALILAAILGIVGLIPLVTALTGGDLTGAVLMFLFSLPFFVIYFRSKNNWWALIPAGVFASIGVVVVLSMLFPQQEEVLSNVFSGLLLLGIAIPFGILWLQRKTLPTDWAKYPAVGLLAGAVMAVLLGQGYQDYWTAVILMVIGVTLLVSAFSRKKPAVEKQEIEEPVAEDKP
jgi:hypothetical protein